MASYDNGLLTMGSTASLIVAIVVACAFALMYYIGLWMTLQKMGRHDFAALVPGYNMWEQSRGAGTSKAFSVIFVLVYAAYTATLAFFEVQLQNVVAAVFGRGYGAAYLMYGTSSPDSVLEALFGQVWSRMGPTAGVVAIVIGILWIVQLVMYVYVYYGIAKSFGHGAGYTIGLLLLSPVFFAILGGSGKQVYQGPMLDTAYRENPRDDWADTVKARIATFGSNAPLALALLGMISGGFMLTLPGVVLCIIALVKNQGESSRPLARAKGKAAGTIAVIGIVLSIVVFFAMVLFFASVGTSPRGLY